MVEQLPGEPGSGAEEEVQVFPSGVEKFCFGGGKVLSSINLLKFPGRLAGKVGRGDNGLKN